MSFEKAYEEFRIYAKKRHKKQSFNNLTHDFKNKVLPYFESKDIYSITEKDILKWKDIISGFNYSNKYNSKIYYVFCEFFDYCYLYYNLQSNYVRDVGGFKRKHEVKRTDYYTVNVNIKMHKKGKISVYKKGNKICPISVYSLQTPLWFKTSLVR